ncbi:MAG: glycosyl transferase [Pseudanabaena frigida]|uniref:Glycosyl transferase n=1 Tax=Pseudanabaena frigida TaxID=945775 RepID=A0A2W4W5I1_9CYAN|nr:MAG: glycosyl transferase [Pseudanabaena frigida]
MSQNVLIYRDLLLPYSETFIPSQVAALSRYTGFYAGTLKSTEVNRLIPQDKEINLVDLHNSATLNRLLFKVFGYLDANWLKVIAQQQPSLIHAHFGPDGLWSLPISRHLNIPLIVTFHGYDAILTEQSLNLPSLSFRLYLKRRQQLLSEASSCIAVSQFIRENLIKIGCPSNKIIVHYIGIDTNKFYPEFTVLRQPIVLFVARLVEFKGCEYLIRAMQIVQAIMPDAELVVIGDGHLRNSLELQAQQSLKKYRFLGVHPPEVVRDWMRRSQVFCVPSITEPSGLTEAFGMVFAEAQAMGLPVVSFKTGGIPEVVAHEETGLLAKEGNVEELSAYIIKILEDSLIWRRFSENGISRVNSLFNLYKQTRQLENIYDDVLAEFSAKHHI